MQGSKTARGGSGAAVCDGNSLVGAEADAASERAPEIGEWTTCLIRPPDAGVAGGMGARDPAQGFARGRRRERGECVCSCGLALGSVSSLTFSLVRIPVHAWSPCPCP